MVSEEDKNNPQPNLFCFLKTVSGDHSCASFCSLLLVTLFFYRFSQEEHKTQLKKRIQDTNKKCLQFLACTVCVCVCIYNQFYNIFIFLVQK